MKRALLVVVVLLAGCADWNERSADFPTYADYAASDFAKLYPADLVPRSARKIHAVHNRDSTEVSLEFDFDAADNDAVVRPFLSFDQMRLRLAVEQGDVPAAVVATTKSILLRCGPGPMEYLKIDSATHAKYWTDVNPERRAESCTNRAASSGL